MPKKMTDRHRPVMRPCQILLLEAYEQLENDVGKEVDRALSKQAEEVARLQRRVDFLQGKLEQQDDDAEDARDEAELLESELKDALERNKKYEEGVYGLPQVRKGVWYGRGVANGGLDYCSCVRVSTGITRQASKTIIPDCTCTCVHPGTSVPLIRRWRRSGS